MPKSLSPRKSPARSAVKAAPASQEAASAQLAGEVFITRQVHFNSAHRLHNPTKSAEWNREQYGMCNAVHGHNYVLEIVVAGVPDPVTGYVVDLGDLKKIMNDAVADRCDHRDLAEVEFLKGVLLSTENLTIAFWREIEPRLPAGRLHCVRLYETPRNFAEYFGPSAR
ncbi:6-pyruvoyl trahydropterin synthase family protein [Oleiharenicola lentus]|uniref:6-pyruvoyl trahydropterin synthase family protein n=1 Tax=Oleiharenicola lentus TaxID=2508720 RepID=UPI003F66AA9A